MQLERERLGADRIATLDIETTHYDPDRGEVVAVGVGVHEPGTPGTDATYDCFRRESPDDEAATIRAASRALREYGADCLLTYNGAEFDLPFLADRLGSDGASDEFAVAPGEHLDLFTERKRRAEARNRKWPSLEECLAAYGVTPAETRWRGEPVTGERFGRELGPAYLGALADGDDGRTEALSAVVDHYLRTDLENNFVVYYGDAGVAFEPAHAGEHASF